MNRKMLTDNRIFDICFSEEVMKAIADDLKPYTEDAMKIDTAPWMKACTEVDMDELYTELTLERLENQAKGPKGRTIRNYKEMFEEFSSNNKGENSTGTISVKRGMDEGKARTRPRRQKGKKILLKGDPGMGKTTLMKKIGWDWARGIFTTFSIVFFVFLKLVEPGEAIENIIVRHTPAIEGMSITPDRVRQLLQQFSEQCLLILDGLDEHALGQNEDVLKIIRGQKLLLCNIIVTSRPHSTAEVERYFRTVARVQGFGRDQAMTFASKILDDKRRIYEVMNFSPSGSEHLHTCPIIFLILCVLVKEDEIDLQSETFSNGELYLRLVRFLYKKYTVNKGLDYKDESFVKLLKKLGKLAWETLREGNTLLQRSRVIKEIGEEAFDYGILIGNEDFRLISKETADILVTFPHRTLQEFLGSYYFVLRLSEDESIDSLLGSECKVARFMLDSLFLHFCLWFCYSDQNYVRFENKQLALHSLRSYVLDRLDIVQFEPGVINHMFPACNISQALKMNDSLRIEFLRGILVDLQKVKVLMLCEDDPLDFILESMTRNSTCTAEFNRRLTTIYSSENITLNRAHFFKSIHHQDDSAIIMGVFVSQGKLDRILKYYNGPVSVYLCPELQFEIELSELMFPTLKKLYIESNYYCSIKCTRDIHRCPSLTHVCFESEIDKSVMSALSRAVKEGNLPNLTHLSFDNCLFNLGMQFSLLLESDWPNLTHLRLTKVDLNVEDFKALSAANEKGLLPRLKSLSVCDLYKNDESAIEWLFKHQWPNLSKLYLDQITNRSCLELAGGKLKNVTDLAIIMGPNQDTDSFYITPDTCPYLTSFKLGRAAILVEKFVSTLLQWELQKLDVSHCDNISHNVFMLLSRGFPSLNILILKYCHLIPDDLSSLGRACIKGAVPNLRYLDISRNLKCAGHLDSLFDDSCLWNDLLILDFTQSGIHTKSRERDMFARDLDVLYSKIENGCLSSLEDLSFTAYTSSYPYFKQTIPWRHVRKINILDPIRKRRPRQRLSLFKIAVHDFGENLRLIVDMIEGGILPSLETVTYVLAEKGVRGSQTEQEKYLLAKSNVCLVIINSDELELM